MANNSAMNLNAWLNEERGRATRLAEALGVSEPTVSDWSTGKKPVPKARAPGVERFTGGCVPVEDTLPELVWLRIPDASWPHPSGRPLLDVAGNDTRNAAQSQGVAANA